MSFMVSRALRLDQEVKPVVEFSKHSYELSNLLSLTHSAVRSIIKVNYSRNCTTESLWDLREQHS